MTKILQDYTSNISHKFLIRLQSIYGNLKAAEKRAADSILEHPEFITDSSIVDAAKMAGCSETTLFRLAQKLGYSGYPELKSSLMQSEEDHSSSLYSEIQTDDTILTVLEKVFNTAKQALTDTLALADQEQYEQALEHIIHARRLYFIGTGDAYTVAHSAYLKFSRIGYNAGCSADIDVQLMEASRLTEQDTLVIISHSGRTQSLYDVAKYAKLNNAHIIAITNYPISPIAKVATNVLLTASFTPNIYNEIMAKRIPELGVIEALYINALLRGNDMHKTVLNQSNKAFSLNKI